MKKIIIVYDDKSCVIELMKKENALKLFCDKQKYLKDNYTMIHDGKSIKIIEQIR